MAKDILKEAIADAKAVREVALANAKAALEEAFTPKLQSMLSAKLSEELEEEEGEDMIDELFDMEYDEDDIVDETYYEEEGEDIEVDLSEEIDLEEILNELGLEEGADPGGCKQTEECKKGFTWDSNACKCVRTPDPHQQTTDEHVNFDLDLLLEKINALSEIEEDLDEEIDLELEDDELNEQDRTPPRDTGCPSPESCKKGFYWDDDNCKCVQGFNGNTATESINVPLKNQLKSAQSALVKTRKELSETKSTLKTITSELNEVNLLNSKLLYVNRIFKANNLTDSQKLRVVETFDKAASVKEAKLIYETIKDTFSIKNTKSTPKKSKFIKEGLGMASKAVKSIAPKKVITETDNMITRMQKLANIKISQ